MNQMLVDQFFELRQGHMAVDEYTNGFYRLARCVLELIPNKASRTWKFERGLRADIISKMSGIEWTNMKDPC